MKKYKVIFAVVGVVVVVALLAPILRVFQKGETQMNTGKDYILWYDEAVPNSLVGFLNRSLPLGNGYMGLNVFGGTETELISVTENSLFNPGHNFHGSGVDSPTGEERVKGDAGGLGLLAKTYIDFGHKDVTNYRRDLVLNDAVAHVQYDYNGVTYSREYFTTYPDKVAVMHLSASKKGALTFTLRPEAVFVNDYLTTPGDGMGKTGVSTANGDTITVKGTMNYFNINYEGLYKVIPQGGTMTYANDAQGNHGTITVTDADSAVIILAVGTNYHLESEIFLADTKEKLDPNEDPHEKVQGYLDAAAGKTYEQLLEAHKADYKELFDRAQIDLGGALSDTVTTDQLVTKYQNGLLDPYLEEIVFQYGRYLLIASSRKGCLPSNLQGIWNFSDTAYCSGGYWHNINVQMNYWPAFSTNLIELFESYVDYNEAFREKSEQIADTVLTKLGTSEIAEIGTGENGWAVGTGCNPYTISTPGLTGHSGPGTGAFTSLLFWDYYDFTRDETILKEHTYPAIEGMAKFLSKTLVEQEDGKWLVGNSASPENANSYRTVGTAFDQQMVYENHRVTLEAAKLLGYTAEDYPILATLQAQVDRLDPVNVGASGQVKEYREENYYGEIGDPKHRHISQLVGVYPGAAITSKTEAWQDAAAYSLEQRGVSNKGWSISHRGLCWARLGDEEQAYTHLSTMLRGNTFANLWSIYYSGTTPVFQIDGNFGYTAMMAEMLIQSHEDCIEFLPAIPSVWKTGSFSGLTARGDFEVDAVWENNQATKFTVRSGSGEVCAVKYENIASAKVTDSKGKAVAFTVDDNDVIRFATVAGEEYTITNIPAKEKAPVAPTSLSANKALKLQWMESPEAVSYNVYCAIDSEAEYTLLASGVTGNTYTCENLGKAPREGITFRVTAVSASGKEGTGATIRLVTEP